MATEVTVQANLLSRIDRLPVTPTVKRVVGLLLLAWLCEAFDIGIVGTAVLALTELWNLSPSQVGLLGAASTAGIVIGLVPAGRLADVYGRKRVLVIGTVVFSIFTLVGGLFGSYWAVVGCRFLAGLGQGAVFPIPYLMAAELLAPRRRATAVGWQNGTLVMGYVIPSVVGAYALSALPPDLAWRLPFLVGGLPLLLAPALVKWLPESPRYLLKTGRDAEARAFVERLEREAGVEPDPSFVNPAVAHFLERERGGERVPFRALLEQPYFGRGLVAGLAYMGALGVWYALLTYSPVIFREQGFSSSGALGLVAGLMTVGAIGNVVQGYASDRYGRKPLYGLYAFVAAVAFVLLSLSTAPVFVILCGSVAAFFGVGIFPVAKTYLAEQYPTWLRGLGTSTGESFARLVTGIVIVFYIPQILAAYGPSAIFAGAGIFLGLLVLPAMIWGRETANVSIEESGGVASDRRGAAAAA